MSTVFARYGAQSVVKDKGQSLAQRRSRRLHVDQALYAKAAEIKWESKECILGISYSEWEPFILSAHAFKILLALCTSEIQVHGK